MSRVIAQTLSDGVNDVAVVRLFNSAAAVWASLNGTGTIALRDDFNIASAAALGTEQYRFKFSNDLLNANNAVFNCHSQRLAASVSNYPDAVLNPNDTSFDVSVYGTSGSGSTTDNPFVWSFVFGDLA